MTEVQTSIRLRRHPDQTMWGYVFTDDAHARLWLRSNLRANKSSEHKIEIERVQVGPFMACKSCQGTGYHQHIKKVVSMDLKDFLTDEY